MFTKGQCAMTPTVHADRSWWGWGRLDAAVTVEEREALVTRVRTLLPEAELAFHEAPESSTLGVPKPAVVLPPSLVKLASMDVVDRLAHARGKAYRDIVRNLRGEVGRVPDAVVRPTSEQDIIDVLDWASSADVAVIPYGGGSSVVGGVEPRFDDHAGVASLDLERLNRVLEVDPVSRAGLIEAGVYGPHLEEQLKPHGLTLRHFPQSFEFSTLGGWLATRSAGHFATLFTHIDDLCESLRVVSPSGVSESWRLPASGTGPSPDRLFLGSEGALGVITEAWMRLQQRPRWRAQVAAHFADFNAAIQATRMIAQSGLYPSNCRLLDPAEAMLNAGVRTGASVLVLAFESADHPVRAWLERGLEIIHAHGGTTPNPPTHSDAVEVVGDTESGSAATWRSAFIRMPYQRDALAQHGMIAETFETATTWDAFDALHEDLTATAQHVMQGVTGIGLLTCRFTHVYPDGPAPYYGVYAPGRWNSLPQQWDEIKRALSDVLNQHRASITHHHAVGRDHRPWYDQERPKLFAAALRAAKRTLDPAGILNPGVLIDPVLSL
jgi:alkyldihydroxyacetonephosphate synthase